MVSIVREVKSILEGRAGWSTNEKEIISIGPIMMNRNWIGGEREGTP